MERAADEFAEMAMRLHDEPGVEETVERVIEYALKAVDCDAACVSLVHGRSRIETAAATRPLIAELDAIQEECGEGPDLNALADQDAVIVRDTRTEERWPTWARRVAEQGIRSMLSVHLSTGDKVVGILKLYDEEPDKFDRDDLAVAHILARHAAIALASARDVENLWRAIDARKLIGQAQGILMERFDLNADQAFAVLLRYSQDNNTKLRDVAELLVSTRKLPEAGTENGG